MFVKNVVFVYNQSMEEKLIVVDGNSLLNRAFYALPLLTNRNGEFSNAVYGFANMLIKVITEVKPTKICVAFDYGKKNFRHALYPDYKGTRKKTPDELVEQFGLAKRMLSYMGITYLEKSGIEADDIIGKVAKSTHISTIILSGDKDVLQLVDPTTEVWLTRKGTSEVEKIDLENLKLKFGWTPSQVIDFKALCGETSDNIPGVVGIGEKGANSLLARFSTLDGVYEHLDQIEGRAKNKLVEGRESAYLSQKLATIDTDCDIDFDVEKMGYNFPFTHEVFNFFEEYDFRSFLKRKELYAEILESKPYENQIDVQITKLSDLSKLDTIKKIAQEEKRFAFQVCDKVEFAFTPNTRYEIEQEFNLFTNGGNFDEWIKRLKEIFESDKIQKVFYDTKKVMHFLQPYGIEIKKPYYDLSIAKYLEAQGLKLYNATLFPEQFFAEQKRLEESLKSLDLQKLYDEIDMPLVEVLFEMEKEGFKIDLNQLAELSQQYGKELELLEKNIKQVVGHEFNLNSPKQLATVLFDELKLFAKFNKKRSTSVEVLNELVGQHEVVELILRYRKIQKLFSTYVEAWKNQFAGSGGIIHTVFNQTLTSTGRLSSSEPNLQNIPIRDDEGKNLRKLFVSKFEGGNIMSADYNQIELRLLAALSRDEKLVDAFKNNQDVHRATASVIFGIPFDEVTAAQRRDAKAVNFGVVYGISDYGLSQNTGMSRKQAKEYIDRYFELYPKVKQYMDSNVAIAKSEGKVKTIFGRVRRIDELKSSNFAQRLFGERIAMNMPLQGSASDIIKIAMINVANALKNMKLKSKLILQIHDELIIDVFPGEEVTIETILHNEMEHVVSFEVPLPVEVSMGKSWFDCK